LELTIEENLFKTTGGMYLFFFWIIQKSSLLICYGLISWNI